MTDLKGKTALITGSTSGIGLGIARKLHSHGVNIILNGFGDAAEIAKIQVELGDARYVNTDLSSEAGVIELMKQAGTVDILVNNAGIQHTSPIEDFPTEKWDLIMGLMLSAPFHAIKAVLPSMKEKKWGRIINIASVHGLVASPYKSAYVAAKHGIVGLTKVVALEAAETGVTCNTICPGWVLTPLVQKQIDAIADKDGISNDEARIKLLSEKEPTLDFTTPEDIGEMVAFLCGHTGRNITGSAYTMDGGWSAR
jgi:3-hydroxybutyrate dehydrogenase